MRRRLVDTVARAIQIAAKLHYPMSMVAKVTTRAEAVAAAKLLSMRRRRGNAIMAGDRCIAVRMPPIAPTGAAEKRWPLTIAAVMKTAATTRSTAAASRTAEEVT